MVGRTIHILTLRRPFYSIESIVCVEGLLKALEAEQSVFFSLNFPLYCFAASSVGVLGSVDDGESPDRLYIAHVAIGE